MRCPACNAENPEGAVTCTSCRAAMSAAVAPAQPEPAARPQGRRLSWLAIIALLAAAAAPWPQVLMIESGGNLLGKAAASNPMVLMELEYGGYALSVIAIITSLIALGQVFGRQHRRGGALALGALLLAVGGMAGTLYAPLLAGRISDLLSTLGGATGRYTWKATALIVGDAILCEIVLAFVRTAAPAPAPAPVKPEPAAKA